MGGGEWRKGAGESADLTAAPCHVYDDDVGGGEGGEGGEGGRGEGGEAGRRGGGWRRKVGARGFVLTAPP